MRDDYPLPDYVPMAATALTDTQRWPMLTEDAEAMLTKLRSHPEAPLYNHACGDRLTQASLDSLKAYKDTLLSGYHGWTSTQEPPWVSLLIDRVYSTVPRYRSRSMPADWLTCPRLTGTIYSPEPRNTCRTTPI